MITTTHKITLPIVFELTDEDLKIQIYGPGRDGLEDYEDTETPMESLRTWMESDYKEFAFAVADKAAALIKSQTSD